MPDPRAHARPARRAPRGGQLSAPRAPLAWLADGSLGFDEVPLAQIAAGVEGHAVLALSVSTLHARLESLVTAGHALDVGCVGPVDVLRWAVERGVGLRVRSRHELALALAAGAPPATIDVVGAVLDDGLLVDALTAGVARVLVDDDAGRANVARIATHLGLGLPAFEGAPPPALHALTGCGVLLAPVLRVAHAIAVDALLPPRVDAVLALVCEADEPPEAATRLHGLPALPEREAVPVVCVGAPTRGDWVAVTSPDAVAPWPPDAAHAVPETVLVQTGRWRFAEPRPLPPRPEG